MPSHVCPEQTLPLSPSQVTLGTSPTLPISWTWACAIAKTTSFRPSLLKATASSTACASRPEDPNSSTFCAQWSLRMLGPARLIGCPSSFTWTPAMPRARHMTWMRRRAASWCTSTVRSTCMHRITHVGSRIWVCLELVTVL
jgi:hypothetical protein